MTTTDMLSRYKILHELGRGGIGAVYAACDRTTGAVVALKRLDPALLKSDANLAERFLKHARSARKLRHRNIVRIHDAGEAAGTAYVAMEMLEGQNLRKILDDGPLPVTRAIQIAHEIACGLEYAHLEAVIHGSIKPSNIIVLRSGAVKIADFGIGQSLPSPEQMRGDPLDHRSDIFSLGALFYEMLTRRRPFEGDTPKEITESILRAEPPPPSELNQHVPRALDAIVLSMLCRQASARMPGVPILLRELQRLEEGLGLGLGSGANAGSDEPAASVPPPPKPEPRPRTPPSVAEALPHRDRMTNREAFDYREAIAVMDRESARERPSRSRPAIFAALALALAVLGIGLTHSTGLAGFTGLTDFLDHFSGRSERDIAAHRMPEAPMAKAPEAPVTAPPEPMPPPPLAAEPSPSAQAESLVARAPEQPASAGATQAQPLPRARQPAAKVPAQPPGDTARLIVAVSPRGELYVDGELRGTTPPVTTFELEPGMHRIEVRNGSRKPYLTYMTVQAGDVRRIRHDFNAKPIRPPG